MKALGKKPPDGCYCSQCKRFTVGAQIHWQVALLEAAEYIETADPRMMDRATLAGIAKMLRISAGDSG